MLFNSFSFLIFFPIVVLVYYLIPKKARYIWLLVASYYFYMSWNAIYAILIAVSTLVTWTSGILISRAESTKEKKSFVAGSLVINLGILFFFKYFDFTIDNINAFLGKFHMTALNHPFDIILPVGISFYTFQALSYTIDVYRGEINPEKNFFRYALYVSFFPQLVAGPIERSKNLLPQIQNIEEKKPHFKVIVNGLILMLWGLFMKMVIADRIAILVDKAFEDMYMYGSVELIVGAIGFALQIYCDFNGYSTIAVGAAKVMGIDIMENFNTPYFAVSVSDFWKRWHISLSTWFRDYVYIPLGGNRKGKVRKYINLMITMLVSGLWHGANWTYVIWGGLHGLYQVIGDLLKPVKDKVHEFLGTDKNATSFKIGQVIITFCLTTFAWIFFRAESLRGAWFYIKRMFTRWNPWSVMDLSVYDLGLDLLEMNILVISLVCLFVVDLIKYRRSVAVSDVLMKQNLWFRWVVVIGLIVAVLVFGEYGIDFDSNKFIYFDF